MELLTTEVLTPLIYVIGLVIIIKLYLTHSYRTAELAEEEKTKRAQIYAGADYRSNQAMQAGDESGFGDIGSIIKLMDNPLVKPMIDKLMTKK